MAVLEKVMQMKQRGQTDVEIVDSLKQEGVSPVEINEALSQSRIKSAIGAEQPQQIPEPQMPSEPQMPTAQQNYSSEISPQSTEMQPSMTQTPVPSPTTQPVSQTPVSEEIPTQYQSPTTPYTEAPQYEEQYYPEYQAGSDIETITEVAEQIIEEKTRNLKKQITSFVKFQEESQLEIERIGNRLEKIENILNELQMAIIGKIGEYGKDIQTIAKEMHSTQDSFSKILNPLTDNIRELRKITGEASEPERPKPKAISLKKAK